MTTRPKFVLFGSSIVQYSFFEGWGATLTHLYARKADIILRGYAAWNSRRALQIMHHIVPKDAIEQPALMIVYFGGNDSSPPDPSGLGPHVPLDEYISNMRNIAVYIRRTSPKTRLIFLSTPPINEKLLYGDNIEQGGYPRKRNETRRIYSEALLELCHKMNIKTVDMWSAIQKREDWKDVCFHEDGIHFTAEGSKIISDEILKVLREANWEPSLHWRSMPVDFGDDSPYDPVHDGSTINVSDISFPYDVQWQKLQIE